MIDVNFVKCHVNAKLPHMAHDGDAGFDLFAVEECILGGGDWQLFPLGLKASFQPPLAVKFMERSSMALKGILVHAGLIDAGYRGEWKVLLRNATVAPFHVNPGDRIAQAVFFYRSQPQLHWVEHLDVTPRAAGGFGSTTPPCSDGTARP